MLRISLQQSPQEVTIKIEGRIAGPWVDELRQEWTLLATSLDSRRLLVDLREVTFVDAKGKQVLKDISKIGAVFLADTAMMKSIVEEVQNSEKGRRKRTCGQPTARKRRANQ